MEESCAELMKKVECSVPRFDEWKKGIRTVAEVNKYERGLKSTEDWDLLPQAPLGQLLRHEVR